jgi:hypothetical protein
MPCDNGEYGKLGQPMFLHRLLSIVAICTEESGLLSFGRIASVLAKVVAYMLLICIKPFSGTGWGIRLCSMSSLSAQLRAHLSE